MNVYVYIRTEYLGGLLLSVFSSINITMKQTMIKIHWHQSATNFILSFGFTTFFYHCNYCFLSTLLLLVPLNFQKINCREWSVLRNRFNVKHSSIFYAYHGENKGTEKEKWVLRNYCYLSILTQSFNDLSLLGDDSMYWHLLV